MPRFELLPKAEAELKSMVGRRAEITKEYARYIEQLTSGQAGKLMASAGETTATVRRRLGQAAKMADKSLAIKRVGEEVYFWLDEKRGTRRRRSS